MSHASAGTARSERPSNDIRLIRLAPALLIHLGCFGVIWVGWSWTALAVAIAAYFVRMFIITAFFHRYFSHRTFRTSRPSQFIFAALGTTAAQRGPLWWASHHRNHHRHSDEDHDIHSPRHRGMWWSHMGWFFSDLGVATDLKAVPDLARYAELRLIDRLHLAGPLMLAVLMYVLGESLRTLAPSTGTNGWQMLVWGFFISTVLVHHATFTINSLAHRFGSRRYATEDDSRNNFWLALLTLGEGWHNNHHYNPGCVRQGFYWWEIDLAYYGLWILSRFGIVWDLRPVPSRAFSSRHRVSGTSSGDGR